MQITTAGIDVAKSVFQVHGVDRHGKVLLRRQLRRAQVVLFFSNLGPCLIGMEACGSSHHWARKLMALGHTVRLMSPQRLVGERTAFGSPYTLLGAMAATTGPDHVSDANEYQCDSQIERAKDPFAECSHFAHYATTSKR